MRRPPVVLGILALLMGLLVPAAGWLTLLGGPAVAQDRPLVLSGLLVWRIMLGVTGLYLLLTEQFGAWRNDGPPVAPLPPAPRWATLAMAGILLLALGLRLYALGRGLWVDEVTTLVQYVRPPLGTILTSYDSQNQHPLYSVLAHLAFSVMGEGAAALRLPAALFGTATIWALWRFGREATSEAEAVLAALVLTVSYQHVWFSQNARGYSGILFWAVLSSWLLLRALREGRPALWAWYAVTVALGAYTHLTMIFVALGQFAVYLVALWRGRVAGGGRWRPFWSGFGLSALLTLLCYALVLPQIRGAAETDLSNVTTWRSPWWMIQETLAGLQLTSGSGVILAVALLVVVGGLWSLWRRDPAVPLLLIVPVVAGGGLTVLMQHHLWPRFFFFAAGFGVVVVVRGLFLAWELIGPRLRWDAGRTRLAGVVTTVLFALGMARSLQWVYRPKQDYVGAMDLVQAQRAPGDTVVVVGVAAIAYRMYFQPSWTAVANATELEATRRVARRTWLLYTLPIEMENTHPDILALARKDFQLMGTFEGSLNGGAVYVYRADGPGPEGS